MFFVPCLGIVRLEIFPYTKRQTLLSMIQLSGGKDVTLFSVKMPLDSFMLLPCRT